MLTARATGIRKKHAVTLCDYRIFTVDAFGVRKSDVPALAAPEVFEHLKEHYLNR